MTDHPKEHGLLFKPDMVRAYFAGLKSQTRRVITRRNSYVDGAPASKELWGELQFDRAWVDPGPSPAGNLGPYLKVPRPWKENGKQVDESVHRVYPRYQVGDVIWGKETWADVNSEAGPCLMYRADSAVIEWHDWCVEPGPDYGAGPSMNYEKYPGDYTMWWSDLLHRGERDCTDSHHWRSPIFMPRWASRIVTPILAVRPERVQGISEEDARDEGVADEVYCENHCAWRGCEDDLVNDPDGDYPRCPECGSNSAIIEELPERLFRRLWDEINGEKYPWANNDWVWPITFKAYRK